MATIEQLKSINKQKVLNPGLLANLNYAITEYEGKADLADFEQKVIDRVYSLVDTHFPEATGRVIEPIKKKQQTVKPQKAEPVVTPEINSDDFFASLESNRQTRKQVQG